MNRQQIVVNTIAFMEQIKEGTEQRVFFEQLAKIGIQFVEVRQEYFSHAAELGDTAREAEKYGIKLLYSVPKQLFHEGRLDTDMVAQTLREARELSVVAIKWTRGAFSGWHQEDVDWISEQAANFSGLLTVENDQTQADGTLDNYLRFLTECREVNVPLYSTFDIGNWVWVNQDPLQNASELSSFVEYIHVKDVRKTPEGGPVAVPLGQGELPLQDVFAELPDNVLVALEYPCTGQPFEMLQSGIDWLERTL